MGLLDSVQDLTKLATQIANPDLLREVSKANVDALNMSRENLELHRKVTELEEEIRRLRSEQDLKAMLYVNAGLLYRDNDRYPYCLTCWDHSRKLIHVPQDTGMPPKCTVCNNKLPYTPDKIPKRDDAQSVPV